MANAFFVAAEFALARVRPTALEMQAREGDVQAQRALRITRRLDEYLTATQLGITLASLALGWLGEPALARFLRAPLGAMGLGDIAVHGVATVIAFSVISLLHIVVGELVPKSLAILQPEATARVTSWPMHVFFISMYPLLYVLNAFSRYLLRRAGVEQPVETGEEKHTAEEIRLIVKASFGDDKRDRTKRDLLERVLRATDRPVRALMVPRVDMVTLKLDQDMDEWLATMRQTGFSRYPVSESGDPDDIAGYIYVKDVLLSQKRPRGGIRGLKRDVLFVPETCSVGDLLGKFQQTSIPLAIVVDEYGGTGGLVTVEDVVEEIVGELHDELDSEQSLVETREDGTLVVDGRLPVGDLPMDDLDADAKDSGDTVSGYIIGQLGRLAHPGDRLRIGNYEATVEDVRRRRIGRVALRRGVLSTMPPPDPDA